MEGGVGEPVAHPAVRAVNERGAGAGEQVRAQVLHRHLLHAGDVTGHQAEEDVEGGVDVVGARGGGGQLLQAQVAQPVQAVARGVVVRRRGQDAQLRVGLGEQEEEQPVQEAQGLAGQLARKVRVQEVLVLPGLAHGAHHVAGDDLHAAAQAVTQLGGDPHSVVGGVLGQGVHDGGALGCGQEDLAAHEPGHAGQAA